MSDVIFICIYFGLMIFIGIYQGKNVIDIRNFSIAERKYSVAVLVALVTSSWITGESVVHSTSSIFKEGIIAYFVLLALPISMFLVSEFIAPRISNFYDCISIGDIIGKSYGNEIKIFVGSVSVLNCLIIASSQLVTIGYIFDNFLNISNNIGILGTIIVILLYSIIGGTKSIITVGILQFGAFIVAASMLSNVSLLYVDGYFNLFQALPNRLTNINLFGRDSIKHFVDFGTLLIPICAPYTVQKLLMTQNSDQAVSCFRYSAFVSFTYSSLIMLIALSVALLQPGLNSLLTFPYLINNFLPSTIKVIAISGVLSIIMFSIGSVINAGSIAVINDIYQMIKKEKLNQQSELNLVRITFLIFAILSIFISLFYENIFNMILFANQVWIAIILVPFLLALYKIKLSKAMINFNIFSSILIIIFWKFFSMEKIYYVNFGPIALTLNIISVIFYLKIKK